MNSKSLLEVHDVHVQYPARRQGFGEAGQFVQAVRGVSFEVRPGETVGLVGESGCGKTTLGRAVLRLTDVTSGQIRFEGEDITNLKGSELRALRRRLQIVFQDPYGALDPRMPVGESIAEALDIHRLITGQDQRRHRVERLLQDVGLEPSHAGRYPHEFSGGQRQRIGIARALAVQPALLVCDEPVSALDVSVQAQVINLLQDLQQQHGLAYLFIAHDLAVVEHFSHRILVMYLGKIVESGDAKIVCGTPKHPYTRALMSLAPRIDKAADSSGIVISGEPPSPIRPPSGCPFHPRCPIAEGQCKTEVPAWRQVGDGHWAACHLA